MNATPSNITRFPEDKGASEGIAADAKESVTQFVDTIKNTGAEVGAAASGAASELKAELDRLIERLPSLAGDELAAAKDQLLQKMNQAKQSADEVAAGAKATIRQGIGAASEYVKESPLKTVALTVGVGILIGMLIGRN
ncbi:YqjD family protein [Undibacterium sp.]|uniref:DUF883 family protein n=1 Tax=Undibacterium sp. TaxID=1914977 RepID=UPI00374D4DDC